MYHTLQMQVGDVIKEINGVNLDYKKPDEGEWVWLCSTPGHHVDIMWISCGYHVDIMWISCDGVQLCSFC